MKWSKIGDQALNRQLIDRSLRLRDKFYQKFNKDSAKHLSIDINKGVEHVQLCSGLSSRAPAINK